MPACPPITVTSTSFGSHPWLFATKVLARQTSRVVTPASFLGLYTPAFLRTSAAIGTVELTGLLMMAIGLTRIQNQRRCDLDDEITHSLSNVSFCNIILPIIASGQNWAHPSTRVLTMDALVLNKSSRVIPGLRGTPAGMTTTLHGSALWRHERDAIDEH